MYHTSVSCGFGEKMVWPIHKEGIDSIIFVPLRTDEVHSKKVVRRKVLFEYPWRQHLKN